ncbi:MAG: hypothetical protein R6X27_04060, partial [Candidatus Desulfacyla sp.]
MMEALYALNPGVAFELFTQVPAWFFEDSLTCKFVYHALPTDIGLVQETPFASNLLQTLQRLDDFYPPDPAIIDHLAGALKQAKADSVIDRTFPLEAIVEA